ncbi:MAG: glycoside hydrolase family 13 protein [Clostridiales bacterium]|jgi:4-alpha-glucanotransferase|nr:glycoside hydrolase family 13 protein [Clostridiales bacterium]
MGAMHNSLLLRFRNPQGPLETGGETKIAIYLSDELQHASVSLCVWAQNGRRVIPMLREAGFRSAWYHAILRATDTPGLMWYHFIIEQPGKAALFYGANHGCGALCEGDPPGYQITVYRKGFQTPRWFREGVMYQIFPDRFKKSGQNIQNAAYHRALGRDITLHNDWNEPPCHTPRAGQAHYTPTDFFGGDLAGIKSALPYLKALGVTCIYLNPVFESGSNHRYDTANYKKIDPLLGSEASLKALAAAAKRLGIRLMLDGVFSHTGADSVYFNKYGRYPGEGAYQTETSPYRSWYKFDEENAGYGIWWGFPELPEVNERNAGYEAFIITGKDSVIRHWAKAGATSWRLDVADELPDAFIKKLYANVKAIDAQGVVLGEVWEDASNKEAYGERRQYVYGDELDSVMNYPFRQAVLDYLLGAGTAQSLNFTLQCQRENYPKPFYYALMNMLSTHDSVRALTALGGAPGRDALSREAQADFQLTADMLQLAHKRFLIATAIQMAAPGVPGIYYGDEAGMTGMADPFNRGAYPWGREDKTLLAAVTAYAAARGGSAAMRGGFCRMGAIGNDIFVIARYTAGGRDAFLNKAGESAAILLCNRAEQPQRALFCPDDFMEGPDANVPLNPCGAWRDARTGKTYICGGIFDLELPPLSASLLIKRSGPE